MKLCAAGAVKPLHVTVSVVVFGGPDMLVGLIVRLWAASATLGATPNRRAMAAHTARHRNQAAQRTVGGV